MNQNHSPNILEIFPDLTESGLSQPKRKQWDGIKQGLRESQLIEQGKLEGKPAADFLNEL